ncbi:uroporphyrinogen-III synthase [Chlorobaculum sp. 24CR]|uniref:uroporphyrinogen-III synthase n=1 Tax=Chlorobaculum sp. 24CR TaxID=2508878 RepID=UPI00100A8696|nr:uroporphyrinogen-III synthase [Chlorobaculum sp. 24CR]RXK81587.1 uroporphyrinogen-III synthase [Chlorobaculum sp. 24CR]
MKTVLVTRPKHQAEPFVRELEQYGLGTVVFPTIEIRPVAGWSVPDLTRFAGIFFTSANSVQFFLERLLEESPAELPNLQQARVWAVGKTTASDLGKHGVSTEPLPKIADAVNLMADIDPEAIKGQTFLFVRGSLSLGTIPELIAERGGICVELTVYENMQPSLEDTQRIKSMLAEGKLDCLSFTSPSTAINFFDAIGLKELPESVRIAAIGTTTSGALEKLGIKVDIIPEYFDGPSFAKAIAEALS